MHQFLYQRVAHLYEFVVRAICEAVKVRKTCHVIEFVKVDDSAGWVLLSQEDHGVACNETGATSNQNIRRLSGE